MATMEKAWQNDVSRVNGGAATVAGKSTWILWYLKQFLTGQIGGATLGLWTVEYSCDSVTAGTAGDGVDRWTTAANVVAGTGAGSIHSWCVLSRLLPNGMTIYLLLDACGRNTSGTGAVGWAAILYSKAAFAGGTTAARPVNTADSFPAPTAEYGTVSLTLSSAAHKVHAGMPTDGSAFWLASSVDASGYCETVLIFSHLADAKIADLYPFWQFQGYVASGQGGAGIAGLGTSSTSPPMNVGRNHAGAGPYATPALCPSIGTTSILAAQTSVDPADSTWLDWPVWVGFCAASPTGAAASIKGRVPDFAFAPSAVAGGSIDVPSGTPTSVVIGNLWVPCNAAPSL